MALQFSSILHKRADGNFQYYAYEPSMAAAVIFALLFGITTFLHLAQMSLTRTWFAIPFVLGGFFELVGYIGRAMSAAQSPGPYSLGPFIMQSILLLVAPALLAATIYMELGRIAVMVAGEHALFVRRTWLTKIFVAGDVFSFLLQTFGAGMLAGHTSSSLKTGNTVIICGLILQVGFFALFIIASAIFHARLRAVPTTSSNWMPWEKHMTSLYVVSVLIFIRSIVRVAEYCQGHSGSIMSNEAFLYVFDALVMWLAMCCMNWVHPSEVAALIRGGRVFTKAWKMEHIGNVRPGYGLAEQG